MKKLSLRLGVSLILILLQGAAIIALVSFVLLRFPIISYVGIAISFLTFFYILKNDEAPAYKLTWIIIVLIIPIAGGIIYFMFSKEHYVRRRIVAHAKEHAIIAKLLDSDDELEFMSDVKCAGKQSLMKYIRDSSSYHAYNNTESKYYPLGELMFDDMLSEISKAEKFILLEYFIIYKSTMWDKLLEVLERKASEGVEVRLIIDDFGSQKLFTNAYIAKLREKKIVVLRFNPIVPVLLVFMNTRDHRKILIVDGHTAFVGGINISDEYINLTSRLGVWKDTGLMLKGDAVWSCTLMFIEMWDTFSSVENRIDEHELYRGATNETAKSDELVLPYGDTPLNGDRLGENIYIEMLNQARRYIYIFTPYLIISEKLTHALQMASRRGVDVRIVTPGIPDKKLVFRLTRSYYASLLEAGIRIFEYTPGFLHAKSFVCDDEVAVVGTINLDYRSLYLHFENAVLLYNAETIKDIRNDAIEVINASREVSLSELNKHRWTGLLDAFLHLFSPLM